MEKLLSIILLSATLLGAQACNNKEEKNASVETPVITVTLSEKRAQLEAQRTARAEKRAASLEAQLKLAQYYTNTNGKIVYYKAETDPSYIGGEKALDTYIHDHLVYPAEAAEQGLEGTVFVDFVVLSNGTVSEVEVINEPGDDIDQHFKDEAYRVVFNMPDWTPGQQHGKTVDVKFSIPVTFQIN